MSLSDQYSYVRYLAAKKTVDDRSLNRHVWNSLVSALSCIKDPLNILEVGAGIGTMLERMLEWGLLRNAVYTAIDIDRSNIVEVPYRLSTWAEMNKFDFKVDGDDRLILTDINHQIIVDLKAIDIFKFISREEASRKWDLLVSHAFLDLIDVGATLPSLFSLLKPKGLLYFTLNFDGLTIFQPDIHELDDLIISLYHKTMDQRMINGKSSGDAKTGRHLFCQLRKAGAELLDAGSSDWVVFPTNNEYLADEAYFLHFIIHTIYTALIDRKLDERRLSEWIRQRHSQIEQGELIYIAHQLDLLGRLLE